MQKTFLGYRRENGRVGVRNHVIILPVDDLVQRRLRGGREQHQGHAGDPAPVRPPAVRRRPRPALPHADRHRLQPERRRRRRHRHRGPVDAAGRRRHRGDRQAGRRLRHRAARRPRHDHAGVEGGARVRAVGERAAARGLRRSPSCGCRPSAASRTRPPAAAPTRRSATRSTSSTRPAARWCSARRPRSPAASRSSPRAAATTTVRDAVHGDVRPLPGRDRPAQDVRPLRLAADEGQHRGRPDDDRGEGARQHPEDRQEVRRRRRARQGRGADRPRAVVHGLARRRRPRW